MRQVNKIGLVLSLLYAVLSCRYVRTRAQGVDYSGKSSRLNANIEGGGFTGHRNGWINRKTELQKTFYLGLPLAGGADYDGVSSQVEFVFCGVVGT
jgi:hypothetical protein